jgi:hypothetical protein
VALAKPFAINGQAINVTAGKDINIPAFKVDAKTRTFLTEKVEKRVVTKLVGTVDGYANAVIDGVKRVAGSGVREGKAAGSISFRINQPGASRDSFGQRDKVILALNWKPLSEKYHLRKIKNKVLGQRKFWQYKGGLAKAVGAIPKITSEHKKTLFGRQPTRKGAIKFTFKIELGAIPEPLQGLMRRSFLEGQAQPYEAVTSKGKDSGLHLLYLLEAGGSGKSKVTRPFISRLSAEMGKKARARLKKLTF